jgi:hypothetical protein
MSKKRPYLHCMMVELIDDFFAEYPAATGELRTSIRALQSGGSV